MNCKPNQLAIVVRQFPGARPDALGKIVRTVALYAEATIRGRDGVGHALTNVWNVEFRGMTERGAYLLGVPDDCLKPINDPGNDAVDEIIQRVGIAPMTLTEVMQWSEVSHG